LNSLFTSAIEDELEEAYVPKMACSRRTSPKYSSHGCHKRKKRPRINYNEPLHERLDRNQKERKQKTEADVELNDIGFKG
jgi:hypothetical protein